MSTRKRFDPRSALPVSPFLTHVALREDRGQPGVHPFTVPWQKVSGGFFLRAETFFNFATYLEDVGSPFIAYGDEPEAALSPQRQLAFLRILHDLTAQKIAQFVIATQGFSERA